MQIPNNLHQSVIFICLFVYIIRSQNNMFKFLISFFFDIKWLKHTKGNNWKKLNSRIENLEAPRMVNDSLVFLKKSADIPIEIYII